MNMTDKKIGNGGPAFPQKEPLTGDCHGMTLRDYFAAKAMQAWVSSDDFRFDKGLIEEAARFSYAMASVMLEERERNK